MNRTKRTLSRVAGLALVLSGAALVFAGQASANDRAVVVSCTDHTVGTWRVSVTFSSIDVNADRPVQVTLGSDSATLTEPGPNGTVTLHQDFGADQKSVDLAWAVIRQDVQNQGVLHLDQPAECREPTTTPATEAPPTTPAPPPTTLPTHAIVIEAAPPAQVKAVVVEALPVTGGPAMPLMALGIGSVLGGLVLVRTSRRRSERAEA